MTSAERDKQWFAWCFQWWIGREFCTDNERTGVDLAVYVSPKGWVT